MRESPGGERTHAMAELISEPIVAEAWSFDPRAIAFGAPPLPAAFSWRGERLVVAATRRVWNSAKTDRGDSYRDRHWFEFATDDGRIAIVYFDRHARRGKPPWWLYTIDRPA